MSFDTTHSAADPTLEDSKIEAPLPGVYGTTSLENFSGRGTLHENSSQNDPLQNSTPPVTTLVVSESLSPADPASLAKKILSRTAYDPSFAESMIAFFLEREKFRIAYDTFTWKNGEVVEKERRIPNAPPQFSEFGRTIGVSERTIKGWAQKHPEFKEAYEVCQGIIQEFMVENGLRGDYPGQFAIFAAKNLTGMKDTHVNENKNYDMKSILDAIEKGSVTGEAYDVN